MDEPVIFKDLPATFPVKDRYKKPSLVSAVVFHAFLILMVVIVPLLLPQSLPHRELLFTLVSPIGPPPPANPRPAAPVASVSVRPKSMKAPELVPPKPAEALVAPTIVPRDVEKIVDAPQALPAGLTGSITSGVQGGVAGGVLGGILTATPLNVVQPIAPPPPPPPPSTPKTLVPTEPVRVGGTVKEPRVLKMVAPVFPPLASRAHVAGTVVLEAIVTAEGTVDRIRVVSGHPLLVQAAIDCVKRWQYEPTLLNGVPTPVILTAKVSFHMAPVS